MPVVEYHVHACLSVPRDLPRLSACGVQVAALVYEKVGGRL
jgi:hypothetical protein